MQFFDSPASLVKGRWTPQASGGIPTGYALHAVTPADGQESLRLAGSAPSFDKGGFCLRGEGGGIARKVYCGRKRARRPEGWPPYVPLFRLDVGRGAPTPPKLVAGRMQRDWQTVGADSISARGSVRGGSGIEQNHSKI